MNVEAQSGALLGMKAQLGLISIALIQTGRERVASLLVHKMRKHFMNLAFGAHERKGKEQKQEKALHCVSPRVTRMKTSSRPISSSRNSTSLAPPRTRVSATMLWSVS